MIEIKDFKMKTENVYITSMNNTVIIIIKEPICLFNVIVHISMHSSFKDNRSKSSINRISYFHFHEK